MEVVIDKLILKSNLFIKFLQTQIYVGFWYNHFALFNFSHISVNRFTVIAIFRAKRGSNERKNQVRISTFLTVENVFLTVKAKFLSLTCFLKLKGPIALSLKCFVTE